MGRVAGCFVLVGASLVSGAHPVESQTCPGGVTPLWTFTANPTQPVSNTRFGLAARTYQVQGSVLHAFRNVDEAPDQPAGSIAWTWTPPTPSPINNFPTPVPLSFGSPAEHIFVTTDNGRLYKIRATDGVTMGSVDTRRPTCGTDKIIATPTVQLYSFSNPTYRSMINDDLIIVITRYDCSDHTHNRVIAYGASNLAVKWTFNPTGAAEMDYGSEGPSIDYAANRIYCGTAQALPTQNTLWAISTIDGGLIWARNAGAILNRPQLSTATNRLYVAHADGRVQAYEPSTGNPDWVVPYLPESQVMRNLWPEFRNGQQQLFFTTSLGVLHAIADLGGSAAQLWPPTNGGGRFTTMPVVATDKLFLGRDDGKVQQLDPATGGLEAQAVVAAPGTLFDPGLDYSSPLAPVPDRLNVPAGNLLKRYCIPWTTGVAVEQPAIAPLPSALQPNAPNPFHDRTRISYRLERSAAVELTIFDLAGHRVRSLMRGEQPAGDHQISWDGIDEGGHRAASGMYFCRLRLSESTGGSVTESRRMLRLE